MIALDMILRLLFSLSLIVAMMLLVVLGVFVGIVYVVMYAIFGFKGLYQKFESEVAKIANLIWKS